MARERRTECAGGARPGAAAALVVAISGVLSGCGGGPLRALTAADLQPNERAIQVIDKSTEHAFHVPLTGDRCPLIPTALLQATVIASKTDAPAQAALFRLQRKAAAVGAVAVALLDRLDIEMPEKSHQVFGVALACSPAGSGAGSPPPPPPPPSAPFLQPPVDTPDCRQGKLATDDWVICAGASHPSPATSLARKARSLGLRYAPAIADSFEVTPREAGTDLFDGFFDGYHLHVEGYGETLKTGFWSAFSGVYTLAPTADDADLALELRVAAPSWTAVRVSTIGMGGKMIEEVRMNLEFDALLVERKLGVTACHVAGKVDSGAIPLSSFFRYGKAGVGAAVESVSGEPTPMLGRAVERMYELIARECFEARSSKEKRR